jgi:hypothetical protein
MLRRLRYVLILAAGLAAAVVLTMPNAASASNVDDLSRLGYSTTVTFLGNGCRSWSASGHGQTADLGNDCDSDFQSRLDAFINACTCVQTTSSAATTTTRPATTTAPPVTTAPAALPAACANGLDDDGDGKIDKDDPGCFGPTDTDEMDPPPPPPAPVTTVVTATNETETVTQTVTIATASDTAALQAQIDALKARADDLNTRVVALEGKVYGYPAGLCAEQS